MRKVSIACGATVEDYLEEELGAKVEGGLAMGTHGKSHMHSTNAWEKRGAEKRKLGAIGSRKKEG